MAKHGREHEKLPRLGESLAAILDAPNLSELLFLS
jgi:hypothetical protein